jgi:very-short-patch-repair endonuclease
VNQAPGHDLGASATGVGRGGLSTDLLFFVAISCRFVSTDGVDGIQQAFAHLVASSRRTSKRCAARCASGELTRIFRHVYAETSYLIGAASPWEASRRVMLLRSCAIAAIFGSRAVISHESAAAVHGIGMASMPADVHICKRGTKGRGLDRLPAVAIPSGPGAGVIPAARLVRHETEIPDSWASQIAPRLLVTDLVTTAVQCARSMPAREATVIVCGALNVLSRFSRFEEKLAASRAREEKARSLLVQRLEELPGTAGKRRARAVIAAADGACESVPERILLWILKAAGFREVRTQVHHRIGRRDYYVDFELPWCHVVIEFDGEGKYGESVRDVHRAYDEQMRRQKDLESIGCVVVRFKGRELAVPAAVIDEVCRRAGCARRPKRVSALAG